jgi:hypothetical protein
VVNKPSIGFEDVEDAEEPDIAQKLELTPADVTGESPIAIRYVRFQSVRSLHVRLPYSVWHASVSHLCLQVFVASNQGGDDETRIDAIDVFGSPVEFVIHFHFANSGLMFEIFV